MLMFDNWSASFFEKTLKFAASHYAGRIRNTHNQYKKKNTTENNHSQNMNAEFVDSAINWRSKDNQNFALYMRFCQ